MKREEKLLYDVIHIAGHAIKKDELKLSRLGRNQVVFSSVGESHFDPDAIPNSHYGYEFLIKKKSSWFGQDKILAFMKTNLHSDEIEMSGHTLTPKYKNDMILIAEFLKKRGFKVHIRSH